MRVSLRRMSLLYSIAFGTHLIQGFAFPFLAILSTWWFIRAIQEPGYDRKKLSRDCIEAVQDHGPQLEPLKCESCGAASEFRGLQLVCNHCGTGTAAPEAYRDVMLAREKTQTDLHAASIFLVRAKRLSSDWVRMALILALVSLCASPVLIIIGSTQFMRYDAITKSLGGVFGAMYVTELLWILCISFTLMVFGKVKRELPAFSVRSVAHPGSATCRSCGSIVRFQVRDLAGVCRYCGAITYRPGIAWIERNTANKQATEAENELIEAENLAKEKFDDLVGTPAIILYLLVVCPFVLFGVPTFVRWAWGEHRGIFIAILGGMAALLTLMSRLKPTRLDDEKKREFSDTEPEKMPKMDL